MRNPINVLCSLEYNAKKQGYVFERLYRNLYNPEFYWLAYKNIAKSQGSMTTGADGLTIDGMSEARILNIIKRLKNSSYKPNPTRRIYIAKKNNPTKKRPLGIPSTDDKLVQEIIRMLLEAIYEPTFTTYSHGFRPKRSCHTALDEIAHRFTGVKWIVEGDIKACFDSFDHHTLINLLRKRIKDEQFISLMWKFLKSGYMEQWVYNASYSGIPQGSGMSPILANIYLSELDTFIEKLSNRFKIGNSEKRKPSHEYNKINYATKMALGELKDTIEPSKRKQMVSQLKKYQADKKKIHYYPAIDNTYKKIEYNRYADDFVIGVIGSKNDAELIKQEVKVFLNDVLKLTLSEEKTKITHSSDKIRYLGYEISVSRNNDTARDKNGVLKRNKYGRVRLYVPHDKWIGKLHEYKAFKIIKDKGNDRDFWKPMHRGELQNKTDVEIVWKYNSEIRGIYNYYRLASNVSVLNQFDFIMNGSMHKTFAFKYRTLASEIRKKYMRNGVFGVDYETRTGTKRCEAYHGGFKQVKIPLQDIDILPQFKKYDVPNSLVSRIKAGVCELCGEKTDSIRMHHVRKLKDLKGNSPSELKMIEIRRKSLALCSPCFEKVKAKIF